MIDELIEEDVSTVSKHLQKMQKKDWVISLFRDLLAQHKTTRKLVNELPNIDDIKETVHEVVKKNLDNCSKMNMLLKKFVTESVKEVYTENSCALEKRSTRRSPDQVILNKFRISGIPEANANSTEDMLNADHIQVDNLIQFFGEQTHVQNIRRLGKQNSNRKQPRTMLVTLSSPWEVRKLLIKGRKLVDYEFPVFLS